MRLPGRSIRRPNMSSSRISSLRRACLVACLLPAFTAAQADVLRVFGANCLVAVETTEQGCGDCCPGDAPADDCPTGCDSCPCCPGVAPAVPPTPFLLAALLPTDSIVVEAPSEPDTTDADRIFRPPRAGLGC